MLNFIFSLIVLAIIIGIAIKLFKMASKFALMVLGIFASVICGLQVAVAYGIEIVGSKYNLRGIFTWSMAFILSALTLSWSLFSIHENYEILSLGSLKFILSSALFFLICKKMEVFDNIKSISLPLILHEKKEKEFYLVSYSAFTIAISAGYCYLPIEYFHIDPDHINNFDIGLWVISLIAQIYVIAIAFELNGIIDRFGQIINHQKAQRYLQFKHIVAGDAGIIDAPNIDMLIQGMLAKLIIDEIIEEVELTNGFWLFDKSQYEHIYVNLRNAIESSVKLIQEDTIKVVKNFYPFTDEEAKNYIESFLDYGQYYNFMDGKYFCSYKSSQVRTCVSCGITDICTSEIDGEWYCSDICKETEEICYKIKEQPYDKFIADAAISGFVTMSGANAWDKNHKMFGIRGKGHGFAAENALHKIDRLSGKSAKIVGNNNAKDGADRLVNGQLIQTKYCQSANRSVNSAFDNKVSGMYRYIDNDGYPMQLEVPKDQYDAAIKLMENKIRDGKVPNVSNPDEARNIIRKGSITYIQANNITKFCTLESVIYDVADGAIISLSASGVSFAITATIYYLHTSDKSEALRAAALQAGKTFSSTLMVYVSTQQLHRLENVQKVLNIIDIKHFPPSLRKVLGDGLGTSSASGINKALRGTIVTSAATIAISSGPDLLKMIRGRISGAQFLQNITIASSGIVGGTIGSIAGGALFTPLGPAGMVAGRIVGGMLGGSISSLVTSKIAGKLREDDRVQMMKIIQLQFEYLAITFMLTRNEVDIVNQNLEKVIASETLEKMYAAKNNRHAFATLCLKPIFVGVIKQRPALNFSSNDVVNSLEKLSS